jgi:hypothetical protein
MIPSRDEYRAWAGDCLNQAEAMHEPRERAILLRIAQSYVRLAGLAGERHERDAAHRQGERQPSSG